MSVGKDGPIDRASTTVRQLTVPNPSGPPGSWADPDSCRVPGTLSRPKRALPDSDGVDLIRDPSDPGRCVDQLTLPLTLEHAPINLKGIVHI